MSDDNECELIVRKLLDDLEGREAFKSVDFMLIEKLSRMKGSPIKRLNTQVVTDNGKELADGSRVDDFVSQIYLLNGGAVTFDAKVHHKEGSGFGLFNDDTQAFPQHLRRGEVEGLVKALRDWLVSREQRRGEFDQTVSTKEACEYLACDRSTLGRWAKQIGKQTIARNAWLLSDIEELKRLHPT